MPDLQLTNLRAAIVRRLVYLLPAQEEPQGAEPELTVLGSVNLHSIHGSLRAVVGADLRTQPLQRGVEAETLAVLVVAVEVGALACLPVAQVAMVDRPTCCSSPHSSNDITDLS